jgi:hypothetical protein
MLMAGDKERIYSKGRMKKLHSLFITLFFVLISAALAGAAVDEYKVKAAMLFNFAKFVDWPAGSFTSDNRFTYCIAGKSPLSSTMQQMQGKSIKERSVVVRHIDRPAEVSGCQVLFIAQSEGSRLSTYLLEASHNSSVTVSDVEQFVESGGIIGFTEEDNKIRFEINQETARKRGIKISSHLLGLARRVLR